MKLEAFTGRSLRRKKRASRLPQDQALRLYCRQAELGGFIPGHMGHVTL